MDIYKRLEQLGIELPAPPKAGGDYVHVRQCGDQLFISGQCPILNGKPVVTGKVGSDITIEQGQQAARVCILNMLSALDNYLGDLNRLEGVIKMVVFVASAPGFGKQPAVADAASGMLFEVFGDKGRHARSTVGTNELPINIPVEIEAILQVKQA